MALTATKAERDKLIATLIEADQKYQNETNALNFRHQNETDALNARNQIDKNALIGHLRTMSSRAISAEQMVARMRRSLMQKLELVQRSLQMKDRQIDELEHSRSGLIESAKTLVKTLKARDSALASAEQRIEFLTEQIAELETATNRAKSKERFEELDFQLQHECEAQVPECQNNTAAILPELAHLTNCDTPDAGHFEVGQTRCLQTLLAGTISF